MKRSAIPTWITKKKTFLALVFLFVVACATSPTGRTQVLLVDDSEMNEMGAKTFEELKASTPIERSTAINEYVKCITYPILAVTDDDTGVSQWEIVVFRDNSANAFALPGGKIGVHTGILQVARTPDQLAAVIGHEIAHVIARHGNERVSQNMGTQGALGVLDGFISGEGKEMVLGAIGVGAQYGVLLPFSRTHESEADIVGQRLMAKAGFDPRQSVELWKNMAQLSQGNEPIELMSTHPSSSRRIEDLQNQLSETLPIYQAIKDAGGSPKCARP